MKITHFKFDILTSCSWIICMISLSLFSCGFGRNEFVQDLNDIANDRLIVMKGYQPIDPVMIYPENLDSRDEIDFKNLLSEFPNEASRIAIGKVQNNGSLTFGPVGVARKGQSYTVIIDYIKYLNCSIPAEYKHSEKSDFYWEHFLSVRPNTPRKRNYDDEDLVQDSVRRPSIVTEQLLTTNRGSVAGYSSQRSTISRGLSTRGFQPERAIDYTHEIEIPVYIGFGLRVQASVTALSDSVNLGSLYGLGIAASQNEIIGTMIIQTLGISGESISPLIPVPDRINESTIQSAMQSLATIKSKLYDTKTTITPQVLGFGMLYDIEGGKDLIESTLHSDPITLEVKNRKIKIPKIEAQFAN